MLETILIIGVAGGSIGGLWALMEIRAAAKKPAAESRDGGWVLRANTWWWTTGALAGLVAPALFLALHFARRPSEDAGTTDAVILAGLFALGGGIFLARAVRYRVFFDSVTIEEQTFLGRRRSLRWADITSVTWSPARSQLVFRGADAACTIRIGIERGFLDFVAAVEANVAREVRGDAVERARKAVAG